MEIEFNNVCANNILDLNLIIKSEMITVLNGDGDTDLIPKLLIGFERLKSGTIKVFDEVIDNETVDYKYIQSFIGYAFDDVESYLNNYPVKKEIQIGLECYKLNNQTGRIIAALKSVGLNESYLNKKSLELSLTDQKKVILASLLAINPKILILNYFERGLNYLERKNLKKLLLKLKKEYNMTIILVSNDSDFYFDIVDRIIVFKNHKIIVDNDSSVFYDTNVEGTGSPSITNFINIAKEKGLVLDRTNDINELIKDIYRKVSDKKVHARKKHK